MWPHLNQFTTRLVDFVHLEVFHDATKVRQSKIKKLSKHILMKPLPKGHIEVQSF